MSFMLHLMSVTLHLMSFTLHPTLYSRSSANMIIGTMFNQPSTRDPKPADWESWSWERKREWWTPRNAARKARKVAVRQKQGEQGTAEKAAAEKTVSSERTQEKLHLHGSHSQNPQFLPSQQHQQGHLAGYTHSGRGELPGAAYQTLHIPPNPISDRPSTWVSPTYMQALPSPYYTPQHKQDYKSCLGNTHALPARPATPLPKLTAGASSAVQSKYRKIEKAREKKFETFEQTVERVRGEERKKLEEERKSMEEEREKLECERKKMEEEWKKIGWERKKMEKERKKVEGERMEGDKEEM